MSAATLQVEYGAHSLLNSNWSEESSLSQTFYVDTALTLRSGSYLADEDMNPRFPQVCSAYMASTEYDRKIYPETKRFFANYQKYYSSIMHNQGNLLTISQSSDFKWMANALSRLNIKDALVQYSEAECMIDFFIILADGMRLSVGRYFNDESMDDKVDFSLFNKKKLLLTGEIKLDELIRRINRVV